MNLATILTHSARSGPDRTALRLDALAVSYAELDEASARVAALLRAKGFQPGDRVAIMLPNVPQFASTYYGVLRAGGVVVPMNVLAKAREVSFYLRDSGAQLLFAWHEFAEHAQQGAADAGAECIVVSPHERFAAYEPAHAVVDRRPEDTAVILYTSGTTGTPKGAELTHANLAGNAEVGRHLLGLQAGDVVLGALPLFHAFGQTCGLNCAISRGACLTLLPRFDAARALEIVERDQVTVFEGVPTMYAALLHVEDRDRHDTSTLQYCTSGGAALPVEVIKGFEAAFGCTVLEGYGLSETSPIASFNQLDRERKAGSVGTPVDGVEMKVVDNAGHEVAQGEVGEILIRGHNVMKGYWNRPDATAETIDPDGWFKSGDLGRVDEDGYFFIVDRKKEMIIRGGYNVYPREIEEVIYEHPAVREAAVVGIPHAELGEEVGAAVALKPGAEVSESELRAFVKALVAGYKYPRRVWFVDELPKGSTGKILRRKVEVPAALLSRR